MATRERELWVESEVWERMVAAFLGADVTSKSDWLDAQSGYVIRAESFWRWADEQMREIMRNIYPLGVKVLGVDEVPR